MSSKRLSVEYDFTPQLKKLSVDDSKEYKQEIYDKTMKKLYTGANSDRQENPPIKPPRLPEQNHKKLKQILLDKNCRLDNERTINNSKEYPSTVPEKCSFCERMECFTSLCRCTECDEYFCSNCSFKTYTDNTELPLCLNCFK